MEYDDGRYKRHSGDCIEGESHMLNVDRVVRLVARAEIGRHFISEIGRIVFCPGLKLGELLLHGLRV